MDNWLSAKHELTYRIKQVSNELRKKLGITKEESMVSAEQEIRQDIELRAYLIYQATKDHSPDDWFQGECECNQIPDFDAKLNNLAQKWFQSSGGRMDLDVAQEIAKIEFKRKAAYYIFENRCRAEDDWYRSEKSLKNEIDNLAQVIMKETPYLSNEEAMYCSMDRLYFKTKQRAYYRRLWIAERAYYLSISNPKGSEYENWCLAAKEYDNL